MSEVALAAQITEVGTTLMGTVLGSTCCDVCELALDGHLHPQGWI